MAKFQAFGVADGWDEMSIYLGHIYRRKDISSARTSAMVVTYASIECENDCFEGQLVKI